MCVCVSIDMIYVSLDRPPLPHIMNMVIQTTATMASIRGTKLMYSHGAIGPQNVLSSSIISVAEMDDSRSIHGIHYGLNVTLFELKKKM